ncbi:ABC transporter permease [Microbacterium phyllosphaerae]|uniref:ABC transporter permease n=1 Tax=Microbacterium phyllosphaerae TaxID=124798 RepID=UPI0021695D46|nr:ABC transporter permease [Microbacterium phyllosphaerae]MCS3442148.1 hypothetical protein [Microbacterium phyllosphaerae]
MKRVSNTVLAREAVLNIASAGWLSVLAFTAAIVIAFAGLSVSLIESTGIVERSDGLTDEGAYLMYVSPDGEGAQLGADRCESLLSISAVKTAGAVKSSRFVTATADGEDWRLVSSTLGYAAVVWPSAAPGDDGSVLVGKSLADRYGLVDGAYWEVSDQGDQRVVRVDVMPRSTRFPDMDLAALETEVVTNFGAVCALEAQPGAQAGVAAIAMTWFSPTEVRVSPHPVSVGARTPQDEWTQRITLWAPYLAAAAVLATTAGWWKLREREFALYAVMGLRPTDIAKMLFGETVLLAFLPTAIGVIAAALTFASSLRNSLELAVFAHDVAVLTGGALIGPAVGLAILPMSSALKRLRL